MAVMSEELRGYLMARRRALLQEVRWIEEALGLARRDDNGTLSGGENAAKLGLPVLRRTGSPDGD